MTSKLKKRRMSGKVRRLIESVNDGVDALVANIAVCVRRLAIMCGSPRPEIRWQKVGIFRT